MKCVECKTETRVVQHETVTLDACPNGHGIWLKPRELAEAIRTDPAADGRWNTFDEQAALEAARTTDRPIDDVPRRLCPHCETPMNRFEYANASGVILDRCAVHGVWLDQDELQHLERWIAALYSEDAPAATERKRRLDARARLATDPDADLDGDDIEERLGLLDLMKGLLGTRSGQ